MPHRRPREDNAIKRRAKLYRIMIDPTLTNDRHFKKTINAHCHNLYCRYDTKRPTMQASKMIAEQF